MVIFNKKLAERITALEKQVDGLLRYKQSAKEQIKLLREQLNGTKKEPQEPEPKPKTTSQEIIREYLYGEKGA